MRYTRRRFNALLLGLGLSPVLSSVARADEKENPLGYASEVTRDFKRDGRIYARARLSATTREQGEQTRIHEVVFQCGVWGDAIAYPDHGLMVRTAVTPREQDQQDIKRDSPLDIGRITINSDRNDPQAAPVVFTHRQLVKDSIDAAAFARGLRTENYQTMAANFRFFDKRGGDPMGALLHDPLPFRIVVEPFVLRITTADTGTEIIPANQLFVYNNERMAKRIARPWWIALAVDSAMKRLGYVGVKSGLQDVERIDLAFRTDGGGYAPFSRIDPADIRDVNNVAAELFAEALRNLQASRGKPVEGRFCLLSTAACGLVGLPDDAWELRTLRRFRDGYLAQSAQAESIRQYYRLSTRLLRSQFAQSPAGQRALAGLYRRMVLPCALLARLKLNHACFALYRRQVRTLLRQARNFDAHALG